MSDNTQQVSVKSGEGRVYLVRTCQADGTSHGGFKWPLEIGAEVTAPDWDANPKRSCGGGFHGLAWGEGKWSYLSNDVNDVWMVVSAAVEDVLPEIDGKNRFRACRVEWVGKWNDFFANAWAMVSPYRFGVASTTGESSHASTTGRYSHASTTGWYSQASTKGGYAQASTHGEICIA